MWEKPRTVWHWCVCTLSLKSCVVVSSNSHQMRIISTKHAILPVPLSMSLRKAKFRSMRQKQPGRPRSVLRSFFSMLEKDSTAAFMGASTDISIKIPPIQGTVQARCRRPTIPKIPSTNSHNPYRLDIILPHHRSTLFIPRPLQLCMVRRHRADRRTRRHMLHLRLMRNHLHIRHQPHLLIQPLARRQLVVLLRLTRSDTPGFKRNSWCQ